MVALLVLLSVAGIGLVCCLNVRFVMLVGLLLLVDCLGLAVCILGCGLLVNSVVVFCLFTWFLLYVVLVLID